MFNLIRRDAIIQKGQLIVFIPFILFFVFMDVHPVLIFLVSSVFIPFNAYAYDEKAETNILLNSLPYTRKEIIAARYIGALAYMFISVALTSIALLIFNKPFTIGQICLGMGLFMIFSAFTFPLFYIIKQGYVSMVVMISFLVLVLGFAKIGPQIIRKVGEQLPEIITFINSISVPVLYSSVCMIILMLYTFSWVMTTYIYQRKAF